MKVCDTEKPADFSFMHLGYLRESKADNVQTIRIGVPPKGPNNKLMTRAVWLDNNRLKTIKHLDVFIESVLEKPMLLAWLDLSFNKLTEIDNALLLFPTLRILYLHGNKISEIREIMKLKGMKELKAITIHGNPVYAKKNYRHFVIGALPQILTLDFTRITPGEKVEATTFEKRIE